MTAIAQREMHQLDVRDAGRTDLTGHLVAGLVSLWRPGANAPGTPAAGERSSPAPEPAWAQLVFKPMACVDRATQPDTATLAPSVTGFPARLTYRLLLL
jgi:hypothetical protein